MSKITLITNELHSILGTTLPTYARIPDSIDIEDNAETYLRKGYSILIGDTAPQQITTKQLMDQTRIFGISLVQQVFQSEHNATGIESAKLALMEDAFTLVKELHFNNDTISDNAIDCNFVGDNGVDYLEGERNKYYFLTASFEIKYRENLA